MTMQIPTESERFNSAGSTLIDTSGSSGRFATLFRALGDAARWLFVALINSRHQRGTVPRMELIETLALGNRRQLFLVVCDKRRYLVGAGADSVGTIVPMDPAAIASDAKVIAFENETKGPQLVRTRSFERSRRKGEELVPGIMRGHELWH